MRGIAEIQEFMEKMGIPAGDLWCLPTSRKTFLDRANYRIEIERVGSPRYFKFEPGTWEADIYKPWICSITTFSCSEKMV